MTDALIILTLVACRIDAPTECYTIRPRVENCAEWTEPNEVIRPGDGWEFTWASCGELV